MFSSVALRASVFLAILVSGCGPDRPEVFPAGGQVVFDDGTPVRLGTVELLSEQHGINAVGTIRSDGSFALGTFTGSDGACAGKHRAIVTQMIIADGLVRHQSDHGAPVDPAFGRYTSSPLTATISDKGPNSLRLTVKKADRRK